MLRNDFNECVYALKCERYTAEDPCEKPTYRFMGKPKCFSSNREGLVGKLMYKLMRLCEFSSGGT